MALMQRPFMTTPARPSATASAPLRRCTFRRVATIANGRELPIYDIACTFPDRSRAVSLGDVEEARPICDACTYQGIFRPDAD